jgi:alkyl hydroperoxide reductase subunit F
MSKIYDLIILGAGPAGITAAIYAARKKMDFLIITLDIGGQAARSGDIENYTGYQFITGPELALKFQEHMDNFGIKVNMPEKVVQIAKEEKLVRTVTDKDRYLSKSVIVATGKSPRLLNVPGEKEFKNKGVTYCATCDGPLFRDKNVAVIGGGNSALDAAIQMMRISPKVYIINLDSQLNADGVMVETVKAAANVEVWNSTQVKEIRGQEFVKAVSVEKDGQLYHLDVEGVFVEIGLVPNNDFAAVLKKNDKGEIFVDCYNATNITGVFAAGDVTTVPQKQIIIACGEGSKACLSAFRYISTHNF